jgi:hypothetical protein
MKIGGWRTWSVFERYAILSQGDIQDAIGKLQNNHTFNHTNPQPKAPAMSESDDPNRLN